MRTHIWAVLLLVGVCGGCASQSGDLKMSSLDGRHEYRQKFSEAYISKSTTGDIDVVLVSRADGGKVDPTQPLKPLASAELPMQMVHIRIYWRPLPGTKFDHPASTNASIHWYMLADSTPQPAYLEYSGSGLVEVDDSDSSADLKVRNAWMKAVDHRGNMVDALGPSMLKGTISAITDADEVQVVLTAIKTASGTVECIQDRRDIVIRRR